MRQVWLVFMAVRAGDVGLETTVGGEARAVEGRRKGAESVAQGTSQCVSRTGIVARSPRTRPAGRLARGGRQKLIIDGKRAVADLVQAEFPSLKAELSVRSPV